MRLNYDLETNQFLVLPGVQQALTEFNVKRGDSSKIEIVFYRGITPQELNANATGKFGCKAAGDYNGDYVAEASSWVKTGFGGGAVYTFTPSWNTVELNSLVASAGAVGFVKVMGEIEWNEGGAISSTPTLSVRVDNDVIKGGEGMPTQATPPYPASTELVQFLPTITALVGGTASDLDGIGTSTGTYDGRIVLVIIGGILSMYLLTAGTETTVEPGIILPSDYDEDDNAKYWQQVL